MLTIKESQIISSLKEPTKTSVIKTVVGVKTHAAVRQYMRNLEKRGLVTIDKKRMKMRGQVRYELRYMRTELAEAELQKTIRFYESIR